MSSLDRLKRSLQLSDPHRVQIGSGVHLFRSRGRVFRRLCLAGAPGPGRNFHQQERDFVVGVPLALLAVSVLKSAFNYGQNYLMNYVGNHVITDIRQELFGKLMSPPDQFPRREYLGSAGVPCRQRCDAHGQRCGRRAQGLFQQGLTFLAMLGVIFYQNWRIGGVVDHGDLPSRWRRCADGETIRTLATRGQERMGDMASTLQEALAGIRMVKAYGREEEESTISRSNKAYLTRQ